MSKRLVRFSILCLVSVVSAAPASAQGDQLLPVVGGGGGNAFHARCPAGQHLLGFNLRAGDNIDAVQAICGVPQNATQVRVADESPRFGGGGGQPARIMCPTGSPVVLGAEIRAEGSHELLLNNIALFCGIVAHNQQLPQYPGARYDAPDQGTPDSIWIAQSRPRYDSDRRFCPAGMIAVGIHGRAGVMVDAMGLICGPPEMGFVETAGRTLGKRNLPDDAAGRTLGRRRRPGDAETSTSDAASALALEARRARGIPALYDYFIGRYLLTPTRIISITRDGNRLLVEEIVDGNRSAPREAFPESETRFILEREFSPIWIRFDFVFRERFDPNTPKAPALFWDQARAVRMPDAP